MKKKDLHLYNVDHIPEEHRGAYIERMIVSYNRDRKSRHFKELEKYYGPDATEEVINKSWRINEESYKKEKHFLEIRKLKLEALIEDYPEYYL